MNRERHAYWSAYIADVQGRMLLGHWKITLERKPASGEAQASVEDTPSAHEASIWFCDDFDDNYSRAEQREAVVHELVHLHLAPLSYHLTEQCGPCEKDDEQRGRWHVQVGHHTHEEFAVHDLARVIAPRMPLPPKVKP